MKIRIATIVGLTVLALTGCSATRPATPVAPPDTYATVVALRDAFKAAGGSCLQWSQTDQVTLAAQSGDCSANTVLMVFSSSADKDQLVSNLKAFDDTAHLLAGENWVINTPKPDAYVDELGGVAVTR